MLDADLQGAKPAGVDGGELTLAWPESGAIFKRKADDPVIAQLHQAALRELQRQPTLGLLATNPLLCAAICALHWLSRRKVVEEAWQSGRLSPGSMQTGVLPGGLWNLCEQLTRMLVHQRDLWVPAPPAR